MPTYVHDGTNWKEIVSTSTSVSIGGNIYVRTSSSGSMDQNRLLNIYVHDGTLWRTTYTAYVVTPPAKPATPTLNRATGWDSRIDQTILSWTSVAGASGYLLEVRDVNLNLIDNYMYGSGTTNSGYLSIDPGGVIYNFRVYAYATNEAGTTYSDSSSIRRVVSGRTGVAFSTTKANNFTSEATPFSWNFSKSANAPDCRVGFEYAITKYSAVTNEMERGYLVVNSVTYTLTYVVNSIASPTRSVYFNGDGLSSQAYETSNGYSNLINPPVYNSPAEFAKVGGGTYKVTAASTGWGTTQPGCQPGSPTALLSNFVVAGYQTTPNTT